MTKKRKNKIIKMCPECHSTKFQKDIRHQETYCTKCGLVILAPLTSGIIYPGYMYVDITKKI
ncbi:TFIIB-type zinc ribbon-containing protein [Methanosphaera cuniculi]|uniref:TFIIB zinc-binding protein n=1 Tax=Methanosphaera cuniculi TaxID=1077256 RepID=A0A2A2HDT1_9EURY|nr:TFIIB-type zinc ribbon-containing protein [Methanosphaera cuniculi]PAV07651.1 hypothetical protein ASJ82_08215 [Methanosphaera cuniculi]PWL08023.1 TFIIB zinc-binding protein [Methanosphaera cuniculi]